MLVELPGDFAAERSVGVSIPVDLRRVSLGIDVTGTESRLVRLVVSVVVRMSEGLSARAITSGRGIERLVSLPRVQFVVRIGRTDAGLVEAGRRHFLLWVIELGLLEDVTALLGVGLLQERVGGDLGPIALVAGQNVVLTLN